MFLFEDSQTSYQLIYVTNLKYFRQQKMLMNKSKFNKNQTPTRNRPIITKITPTIHLGKKSDPFLKQLKQVYDKQNLNPNTKNNRINSQHSKETDPSQSKNSQKKLLYLKNTKNGHYPCHVHQNKINRQYQSIQSNTKYHSTELNKTSNTKHQSNRNSNEKDQVKISHFQDDYYTVKDEKRDKKMKLTLKDMKKQKKMLQHCVDNDYMGKFSGQTRQSTQKQVVQYHKYQNSKMQHSNSRQKTFESTTDQIKSYLNKTIIRCFNHPQKKATRRVVQQNTEQSYDCCQKCAVGLATKGYNLIKLSQSSSNTSNQLYTIHQNPTVLSSLTTQQQTQEQRKQNLKSFIVQLDRLKPKFHKSQQDIILYKQILRQKYQGEQSKLKIYYNKIQDKLQHSYHSNIFQLKLYYQALEQQIQKKYQQIKMQFTEIQEMKRDILPNIDKIIEESYLQQELFKEIIKNYYGQFYNIKGHLQEINVEKINFYEISHGDEEQLLEFLLQKLNPKFQHKIFDLFKQRGGYRQVLGDEDDPFRMSFGKDNSKNTKNFKLL